MVKIGGTWRSTAVTIVARTASCSNRWDIWSLRSQGPTQRKELSSKGTPALAAAVSAASLRCSLPWRSATDLAGKR